ncbi:MAG: metallophosphoesterase [Micrococcales bacterium]
MQDWLWWPVGMVIALMALGLAAAIWGIFIERQWFRVVVEQQAIDVLPAGSEPIRVLHVSDFHIAPWQGRKLRFISRLADTVDFDLVVDTGDNLGHLNAIEPTLRAMQGLLGKPGVFVNGSNDYFAPKFRNPFGYLAKPSERKSQVRLETEKLTGAFEAAGWLNLNNASCELTVNGTRLDFVGIDDHHDGLSDLESIGSGALIGVSHAPYLAVIDAMNDAGVKLLFAGHTHGGQVCIPGYGALTTNCDLPTKAAKGLSSWSRNGNQLWLQVCAGLGHSIFAPVRFACPPEVRLLTLVAKN